MISYFFKKVKNAWLKAGDDDSPKVIIGLLVVCSVLSVCIAAVWGGVFIIGLISFLAHILGPMSVVVLLSCVPLSILAIIVACHWESGDDV